MEVKLVAAASAKRNWIKIQLNSRLKKIQFYQIGLVNKVPLVSLLLLHFSEFDCTSIEFTLTKYKHSLNIN